MKKKVFKIIICFLTTISFFLFNSNVVKADEMVDLDKNGTPGIGGKDPCDPWSYVCIYNYAAFKVTYYSATGTYKSKIYYTKKYSSNPFNNPNNSQLKGRFKGTDSSEKIDFSEYGFGSVPKQFTSKSAQKVYEKIWNKMSNKDSRIVKKIFNDLMGVSDNNIVDYIKNHKSDYIFVEPLFQVKIQKYEDAHNALRTKKGNFSSFYGSANGVADEVVSYYDSCKNNHSSAECASIFKNRSEKGHVSRIANSLRLEKKVSVGGFNLSAGNPKAKRYKTKMEDLTKDKGYGIGAIKLSSYPISEPPEEKSTLGTCYSYASTDLGASCEIGAPNYQTEIKTIELGEKTTEATSCTQGALNEDGTYQSQSIYGELVGKKIQTYDVGDYCAIYCTKNISFSSDISGMVGMKEISPLPAIANSSTTYYDNFKIEKKESYTCHVDVTKYYGSRPTDDWFTSLGDNNYAQAYFDIEEAKKDHSKCLIGVDLGTATKDSCLEKFNTKVSDITNELWFCAYYKVIEPDIIDNSSSTLKIKINGKEIELIPEKSLGDDKFQNHQNINGTITQIPKWDGENSTFGAYITKIQTQVNDILNQGYIYYNQITRYTLKNTTKYTIDNDKKESNEDDKKYGDISDITIDDNSVCKMKQKLLKSNKSRNETKISISDHSNLVCDDTITNSDYVVAECPANTYHAGTNAYYWLANNLIKDETLYKNALEGINSAEAINKFCNNKDLEKFEGGYEPIISENGEATLDDCLKAGVALNQCQENAGITYECTDGRGIKSDVSYYVYLKAKQKNVDLTNKAKMDVLLNEVKQTNPYCTNACYGETDKNKNDFVYRTISLDDKGKSFPGKNGTGRKPGANWDSDDLIKTVITDMKDIYINTKGPMYRIELNSNDIKKIREYNRTTTYDDFKLDCDENGAACISRFLNETINVTGNCADVNKTASSFYGPKCVNYNARGEE